VGIGNPPTMTQVLRLGSLRQSLRKWTAAMDVGKSHRIVKALSEGTDPFTGEVLVPGHVCQQPEVVRALMHAAQELERLAKRERNLKRARLTLPQNTGKEWSHEEDRALLARFKAGVTTEDMALIHARTSGAIHARLAKLGLMQPVAAHYGMAPARPIVRI
jgi:hypothetical protein